MKIDNSIFRAYDIRGKYPEEINGDVAFAVGKALVQFLKKPKKMLLCRDGRMSSPALRKVLIKSITEEGTDIIDIGMASVDIFYFACAKLGLPGFMITASHNPSDYNGIRMVRKFPILIGKGFGMEKLAKLARKELKKLRIGKQGNKKWIPQQARNGKLREKTLLRSMSSGRAKGKVVKIDIMNEFIKKVKQTIDLKKIKPLRVLIDPSNGMTGLSFNKLEKHLPIKIVKVNFTVDGRFPGHGPNPLVVRAQISKLVKKYRVDLGLAFDCDGDRMFAIDENGRFIPNVFITALMAEYFLGMKKHANKQTKILSDLRSNWSVKDMVKKYNGKFIESKVGDTMIKKIMFEEKALFGGESTGHYYFRDFYYADSGLIAALILLKIISAKNQKLSKILAPLYAAYFVSAEFNFKVQDKQKTLNKIKTIYGKNKKYKVTTLDGVSVELKNPPSDKAAWHFNARISANDPVVRLNVEAKSAKMLKSKVREIREIIKE